jgi:hypothetical protein
VSGRIRRTLRLLPHPNATKHDALSRLPHEVRDPPHHVEILTSTNHRDLSPEVVHVQKGDPELAAKHMPGQRRVRIPAPRRWRIASKHERSRLRELRSVIRLRFDLDPVTRIAGAVANRTTRLDHHVRDRAMDRELSIERTGDSALHRWIEPFGAAARQSDEESDRMGRATSIEQAANVALVGLQNHGDRPLGIEPGEGYLDGGRRELLRRSMASEGQTSTRKYGAPKPEVMPPPRRGILMHLYLPIRGNTA